MSLTSTVFVIRRTILSWFIYLFLKGFAKAIFYFRRADSYAECNVLITSKEANTCDGEKMQVLCLLEITGTKNMLEILKSQLCKNI